MTTGLPGLDRRASGARGRRGALVSLLLALLMASPASAEDATSSADVPPVREPTLSEQNGCPSPGGQGIACDSDTDCEGNTYATDCIDHPEDRARCEIPCSAGDPGNLSASRSACATGETCVEGETPGGQDRFYCKPTAFRMDLNLLDQCIEHFLAGVQPVFGADSSCSLDVNLNRLLDQDANRQFDVLDMDLCVLSFLEQPGCKKGSNSVWSCPSDLIGCDDHDDCGDGLHCDVDADGIGTHSCRRDCGVIPSREPEIELLDRECSGALQVCNRDRGRCTAIDPRQQTCDVDRDCPPGAYCFLARCEPTCYRTVDCPGTEWYCTDNNRCRPLPTPVGSGGFVFDPLDYAIRFGRTSVTLNEVDDRQSAPLFVMDLRSRRQVIDNPSVRFGYRLEITYHNKADSQCLKPFVDCSDADERPPNETEDACNARQSDCIIDDTENWIRPLSPFGTVAAVGDPRIVIELEKAVADKLTPGTYSATVRSIYDNGDSDSFTAFFEKPTPSGEYAGTLDVYLVDPENLLTGARPLVVGMRLELTDTVERWSSLMETHGITEASDSDTFVDVTRGQVVYGRLHGNDSFAFTRGGVTNRTDNEIELVGLYSPDVGRIRVIGMIEIPSTFCISENGACDGGSETELQVRNLFGRTIRRRIEFVGPFDSASGRFFGVYREKLSGLAADFDVTMEGTFVLEQIAVDESPITPRPGMLLADGTAPVRYPDVATVMTDVSTEISGQCAGGTTANSGRASVDRSTLPTSFSDRDAFDAYLGGLDPVGSLDEADQPIFSELAEFSSAIEHALGAIDGTTPAGAQDELNIFDFVSNRVLPCDPADPAPGPVCIDSKSARCGLALQQKALLNGWVDASTFAGTADEPVTGEHSLFCVKSIPTADCPADPTAGAKQKALFALQEHNRFWKNLSEIRKFQADRARSDAFHVLFRNEINPFSHGAALDFKDQRLREGLREYDELVKLIAGPAAGKVLFEWPARAFKSAGASWTKTMHTIVGDRMEILSELVDLKRRIFLGSGATDFLFAQHMMQQEYLLQVYLMVLQWRWQGELFAYEGQAARLFEQGQAVLNQLNPAKNRLGVTPDQVFFESSDPLKSNWESYKDVLVGEDGNGGLLTRARDQVADAIDQLKSSLRDLDSFEENLQQSKFRLIDKLNDVCGSPNPVVNPSAGSDSTCTFGDVSADVVDSTRCDYAPGPDISDQDYCQWLLSQYHDYSEWARARDCKFGSASNGDPPDNQSCPPDGADAGFYVSCPSFSNANDGDTNTCTDAIGAFFATTDAVNLGSNGGDLIYDLPKCAVGYNSQNDKSWIFVNGQQRPCVGGQIGNLLQRLEEIDLSRDLVTTTFQMVIDQMKASIRKRSSFADITAAQHEEALVFDTIIGTVRQAMSFLKKASEGTKNLIEVPACTFIAGFSVGTDCPGSIGSKIAKFASSTVFKFILQALELVDFGQQLGRAVADRNRDAKKGAIEDGLGIEMLERDVDPLLDEYALLSQQYFNVGVEIEGLRRQAQAAVDRYSEEITFIADHLVGRETGNVLLGDHLVGESAKTFSDLVQYAYRMAVAFDHRYNLAPGDGQALINQAMSLLTLDEVEAFVHQLSDRARDYCGLEAIDCDNDSNVKVLRYSVRDNLFGQLTDVIDARTGAIRTAGQRFHGTITAPPYVKRRKRGPHFVEQIEIPIALPVTLSENTAQGARWLIDPLTCNHQLATHSELFTNFYLPGTVAVNVQVNNRPGRGAESFTYELIRGATDFTRSCHLQAVQQEFGTLPELLYPIRKHIVGYAPQSVNAQKDEPPSYATRSAPIAACVNATEVSLASNDETCWTMFARDRSLASHDWKLVIPLSIDEGQTESAWILGEGLPADERPIIEDVEIYFRYRSRPVQEF